MFEVRVGEDGVIQLSGRCDANSSGKLREALERAEEGTIIDCAELTYFSSDPIGVLFAAHKRLLDQGSGSDRDAGPRGLVLVNLSDHIREVFRLAGFDAIFTIEDAPP